MMVLDNLYSVNIFFLLQAILIYATIYSIHIPPSPRPHTYTFASVELNVLLFQGVQLYGSLFFLCFVDLKRINAYTNIIAYYLNSTALYGITLFLHVTDSNIFEVITPTLIYAVCLPVIFYVSLNPTAIPYLLRSCFLTITRDSTNVKLDNKTAVIRQTVVPRICGGAGTEKRAGYKRIKRVKTCLPMQNPEIIDHRQYHPIICYNSLLYHYCAFASIGNALLCAGFHPHLIHLFAREYNGDFSVEEILASADIVDILNFVSAFGFMPRGDNLQNLYIIPAGFNFRVMNVEPDRPCKYFLIFIKFYISINLFLLLIFFQFDSIKRSLGC